MANITLDGLPAKTGTISDAGIIHYREGGVDKKMTIADFLIRISEEYSTDINTFLGAADKAAARAALNIARRTAVSNANYTILATDKFVSNTSTLTAARTFTLPSAALYPAGEELIIEDKSFSLTKQFPLTISRAGSDTFNDGSTSRVLDQKGALLRLISDGVSTWSVLSIGIAASPVLFSNRNVIINGDFNIWQRGISFASVGVFDYTVDNWIYGKSGAMTHDISRSNDVPSVAEAGRAFNYSMLIECKTAQASIGAGNYCYFGQFIEGYNFLPIAQKTFTISFWVKATKIGIYNCALINSGYDKTYVAEFTINNPNAWEYKTITVSPSPSSGTWNYTNGVGVRLEISLACGSTRITTANSWQNGDFLSTSNQVNACDNIANNFRITGIQLEAGSVATPFEQRLISQELVLCQRYFEILGGSIANEPLATAAARSTAIASGVVTFKVEKRATPSISFSAANKFRFNNANGNYISSAVIATSPTVRGFLMDIQSSGMTANTAGVIDTVDASGKILISSEL